MYLNLPIHLSIVQRPFMLQMTAEKKRRRQGKDHFKCQDYFKCKDKGIQLRINEIIQLVFYRHIHILF